MVLGDLAPYAYDIGKNVLAAGILLPIVWFLLRDNSKHQMEMTKALTTGFNLIATENRKMRQDFKDIIHEQTKELRSMVGKNILNVDQSISAVRDKMWYYSDIKLKYLKDVIERNHLATRKAIISRNVAAELRRLSQIYIDELNEYNSPIGKLGDFIDKNFMMDEFLSELFDVLFRKPYEKTDTRLNTEMKINDISSVMKKYQNFLLSDMRKESKK